MKKFVTFEKMRLYKFFKMGIDVMANQTFFQDVLFHKTSEKY